MKTIPALFFRSFFALFCFNLTATNILGDENQSQVAEDMLKFCQTKGCDLALSVGGNIW